MVTLGVSVGWGCWGGEEEDVWGLRRIVGGDFGVWLGIESGSVIGFWMQSVAEVCIGTLGKSAPLHV